MRQQARAFPDASQRRLSLGSRRRRAGTPRGKCGGISKPSVRYLGAARSEGRSHEGTDIFAAEGTPVYSATIGYVQRIGANPVGGNIVTVIGGAGVPYYYAHLAGFAEALEEGQYVTPDTLLGYVSNTGNAVSTPPHLHFGVYAGESYLTCDWDAENPYPLLVDRVW